MTDHSPEVPPRPEPVPPYLLACASQMFDVQEYLDGLREIETTGGHTFESFIGKTESLVRGSG